MHELEKHIGETIERRGLLRRSSPVLVALSGGADSVALLSILNALGYDCIAAHCNFHLRGAESTRDMRHAETIARQLGVNIYIREFDVQSRIRQTGESVEMACREMRYTWFHELLDRDYSQAIAVGHHREDNIETFFLNLLRSSGLAGLTGMDYKHGYVVRPMLDVSRAEIEKYITDKGLYYVNDSSNFSNDFKRNKLRNVILPVFKEHFPQAFDAVLASMEHLRDAHVIVNNSVTGVADRIATLSGSYDVNSLIEIYGKQTARIFLFEILKKHGLNASQVNNIVHAVAQGHSGLRFDAGNGNFAELDRGILSFHSAGIAAGADSPYTVSLKHDILTPVNIQISRHNVIEFRPERNPDIMYLDASALTDNAVFEIRRPRTGDRLKPYGMKGEKLVSDILKDAKFSSARKREVLLLTRNDTILWIIGLRTSAHFPVSPSTRHYLRLHYIP